MGFAASAPGATPVPESGMLKLRFEPVEVILTLPLAAPLVVGEKSTVKDALWPALNVKGRASPLKLNPVPLAVAAETVRLVPPVLVRFPVSDFEVPTWMLPNARLVGFAASTAGVTEGESVPGATPTPEKLSTTLLFTPSAVIANVTLPLRFPAPVGANVIVTGAVAAACSVRGRARLLIENPAPLMIACVTVRSVPPLFERVTVLVWLDPTLVFPKAICEGLGESFPRMTPLPEADRETIGCAFGPSKEIVMVGSPESVGWYWTLKEAVCPDVNSSGVVMPVTWKPEPNP